MCHVGPLDKIEEPIKSVESLTIESSISFAVFVSVTAAQLVLQHKIRAASDAALKSCMHPVLFASVPRCSRFNV